MGLTRREFMLGVLGAGIGSLINEKLFQINRPEVLVDPAIPEDKQIVFENLINTWTDKIYTYYPTVERNSDLMANYRIVAYRDGRSIFNILPNDSSFRLHLNVYTRQLFDNAEALTQATDTVFHIGEDVDVNNEIWQTRMSFEFSMGVISHLLKTSPNDPPFSPAWLSEGEAFLMHNDLSYGQNNWSNQQDINSAKDSPIVTDLSQYEDRSSQAWIDGGYNAYALASLVAFYLNSLTTGTTDAGLQLIERMGNGQTFEDALFTQTGLTKEEFYTNSQNWLSTQQTNY